MTEHTHVIVIVIVNRGDYIFHHSAKNYCSCEAEMLVDIAALSRMLYCKSGALQSMNKVLTVLQRAMTCENTLYTIH